MAKNQEITPKTGLGNSIKQLFKLRLSFLVVVSAVLSYWFAKKPASLDTLELIYLIVGGFLITGSSNTINQIIEKDLDKKMARTQNRPLPQDAISKQTAWLVALISGVIGAFSLYQINFLSFALGVFALISYAFIYTPLKQKTPFAVFVGAFPGAIPPLLGWVAGSGEFGLAGGLLFTTQFIWQFPHFWAIAWVLHDDYRLGGFSLLPTKEGKGKTNAFQILMYTIYLLPISILPWLFNLTGLTSMIVCLLAGLPMLYWYFQYCDVVCWTYQWVHCFYV